MSVKGLSDFDEHGNEEPTPNWPFRVRLIPHDVCNNPNQWHGPFFETLTNGCIQPGSLLFDVLALDNPKELGGIEEKIGEIYTTTQMVTSLYGDTKLFFKHQRFEEDIEARMCPAWCRNTSQFVCIYSRFYNTLLYR